MQTGRVIGKKKHIHGILVSLQFKKHFLSSHNLFVKLHSWPSIPNSRWELFKQNIDTCFLKCVLVLKATVNYGILLKQHIPCTWIDISSVHCPYILLAIKKYIYANFLGCSYVVLRIVYNVGLYISCNVVPYLS